MVLVSIDPPVPPLEAFPHLIRKRSSRTLSPGSSFSTVPLPTMTASASERRRCTRKRENITRNPAGIARMSGDPAIERYGRLVQDERPSMQDIFFKWADEVGRLGGHFIHHNNIYSRPLERLHPPARHAGIGIEDRDENAPHTRGDQGISTRWGFAVMAARLKRNIQVAAVYRSARVPDRAHLGVIAAAGTGRSGRDHLTVPYQDGAHRRVRGGGTHAGKCQPERPLHVCPVNALQSRCRIFEKSHPCHRRARAPRKRSRESAARSNGCIAASRDMRRRYCRRRTRRRSRRKRSPEAHYRF